MRASLRLKACINKPIGVNQTSQLLVPQPAACTNAAAGIIVHSLLLQSFIFKNDAVGKATYPAVYHHLVKA